MKKIVTLAIMALCATAIVAQAEDKPKKELTPEQEALKKTMLDKYDTNKDGHLDKEERSKISQEDKDKMAAAGLGHKKAGEGEAPAAAPAAPAADK